MECPDVIYQSHYSYRKRSVVVISSFLLLVCVPLALVFVIQAFRGGQDWSTRLGSLFIAAFVGAFGGLGWWLFRAWLMRKTLDLVITPDRVEYGGRSFPWEAVKEVRLGGANQTRQIVLLRRGFTADVMLVTDTGISPREYEVLMSILDQVVTPRHTHLHFT